MPDAARAPSRDPIAPTAPAHSAPAPAPPPPERRATAPAPPLEVDAARHGSALRRRLVSIPAYVALFAVVWGLLPVALPLVALSDALRGRRLAGARLVLMLAAYLALEMAGLLAAAALGLAARVAPARGGPAGADRWTRANFRLQCWWGAGLFGLLRRLLGMRVTVTGEEAIARGPLLLFIRHASTGDTILPVALVSAAHGLRLRYVLKAELLWEPCLDIVGHRLRNAFIRRGAADKAPELAAIRGLAAELGPDEGVLLYPEGTRFTEAKRQRAIARHEAAGDPEAAALQRELTHVLAPRTAGALALLDAAPGVDVVFCAHTGFEGTRTFLDLWNGGLVGRHVRVACWRVPGHAIPSDPDARVAWLRGQWRRVNAWVRDHAPDDPAPPAPAKETP